MSAPKRNGHQKRAPGRKLARPGDPLVLNDGRVIAPEDDGDISAAEKYKVKPQNFRSRKRRAIKDLPAPTGTLNGIACVFVYTVLGVSDGDIADALSISTDQVKKVRKHSAYAECFEAACDEFINANSDLMTARLASYAHDALTGIHEIAKHGKKENNKLKANMDIMNRGGYTAKEQVAKTSMHKSELRIVHIDGETEVEVTHTMNGG